MNLQAAMNCAAKKFGYRDYLDAQKASTNNPNPELSWRYFDYLVLGEVDD